MSPQPTNILHCERCGSIVYHEMGEIPRCCNAEMRHAAADYVWQIDECGMHRVPVNARSILEAIQLEHRDLHRRLADERTQWNLLEMPDEADFAATRLRLRNLRHDIRDHFLHEEKGGYLTHIVEVSPSLGPQVSRISDAHGDFLQRLGQLVDALNPDEPETWNESRADFGRFVRDLRAHEAFEMSLIPRAFNDEVQLTGEAIVSEIDD